LNHHNKHYYYVHIHNLLQYIIIVIYIPATGGSIEHAAAEQNAQCGGEEETGGPCFNELDGVDLNGSSVRVKSRS